MFNVGKNPWIVAAMYLAVTVLLPWVCLFLSFGYRDGWFFIGLYSHLFLFPLFFAPVLGLFAYPTLLAAHGWCKSKLLRRTMFGVATMVTFFGCIYEFTGRPAVFEMAGIHEKMAPDGPSFMDYVRHPSADNKELFDTHFPSVPSDIRESSWGRYAYWLSFAFQTYLAVLLVFAYAWIVRLAVHDRPKLLVNRHTLIYAMLGTWLSYIGWFLMRLTFEGYKAELFEGVERPSVTLGPVFLLVTLFVAALIWRAIGEKLELVIGVLTAVASLVLLLMEDWRKQLFPKDLSIRHFALLSAVFVVMLTGVCVVGSAQRIQTRN